MNDTKEDLLKQIQEHNLFDGRISERDSRGAMVSWLRVADKIVQRLRESRRRMIGPLIEDELTFDERELLFPYGIMADDDFEFMSQLIYDGVSELLKRKRSKLKENQDD